MPAQVVIPGNQLFTVSTPLPAMVEQTLVGVGDPVRKGQTLASLQSPALAEAQRGLLQASTQEQLARENLPRDEQLWKDGIIAESRYRATHSMHIEATAALAERKQLLRLSGMPDAPLRACNPGQPEQPARHHLAHRRRRAGKNCQRRPTTGSGHPPVQGRTTGTAGARDTDPLASTQGLKIGAPVTSPHTQKENSPPSAAASPATTRPSCCAR